MSHDELDEHDELDADAMAMLRAFRAEARIPAAVHERVWDRVRADVAEPPTPWFRRGAALGVLVAAAIAALWMGRQALDAAHTREPASQAGYEHRDSRPGGVAEHPDPARAKTAGERGGAAVPVDAPPLVAPPIPEATAPEQPSPAVPGSTRASRPASGRRGTPPQADPDPTPAPAPALGSTLAAENRLLARARAALIDEQPERALTLLGEHAQRFPQGVLAEERQALRAVALCEAGRTTEGQLAARAFLREHPQATLAERVRGTCLE